MASNVTDPKKMTITIRIVDEGTITFKQWYSERPTQYASETEALKHWEAMCVGTGGLVVCDKDEGDFKDYEDWFWDIEEEHKPEEVVFVAGPPEPLVKGEDYEEEEDLLCMKCNTEHEGNWCPEAEEEEPELIYSTIKDMKVNELTGTYYQTYGGGPEGGYYKTNERWYRLHRTWYQTWRVTLSQDMHVLYENGEPSKIEPEHQILPPA